MAEIQTIEIDSKCIKNNLLDDRSVQKLSIWLPNGYSDSDKRYPVIYFLNGFLQSHKMIFLFSKALEESVGDNIIDEFIMVGINGRNVLGGSFYMNSKVTGYWEDYVITEVVPRIDNDYRTIADGSSRAIAGFSMGGGAAIGLAAKYPDVFSCTYSNCPAILNQNHLKEALDQWASSVKVAFGSAVSFDLKKEKPFAVIPLFDGSKEDNNVIEKWKRNFVSHESFVEKYANNIQKLKAARIDFGLNDQYKWIPSGIIEFKRINEDYSLGFEINSYNYGHEFNDLIVKDQMLHFFSKYLKFH